MTARFMIATLAATFAVVSAADAFVGPRGTQAAPVNNVIFEVGAYGSGTSDDLWCGAADFARRALGAGWKVDIYVARGRGRGVVTNRSIAAQFTLDPSAAGIKPTQGYSTLAVGYSMSVQRANTLCSMPPDLFFLGGF